MNDTIKQPKKRNIFVQFTIIDFVDHNKNISKQREKERERYNFKLLFHIQVLHKLLFSKFTVLFFMFSLRCRT